jgi:hypothetical protein
MMKRQQQQQQQKQLFAEGGEREPALEVDLML